MTSPNAVTDVNNLIKIPNKVSDVVIEKLNLCIGSILNDAKLAGDETVSIGIGIGTLCVNLTDMQCKFLPSKELKQTIKTAIQDGIDPLVLYLDQALQDKLLTICTEAI